MPDRIAGAAKGGLGDRAPRRKPDARHRCERFPARSVCRDAHHGRVFGRGVRTRKHDVPAESDQRRNGRPDPVLAGDRDG